MVNCSGRHMVQFPPISTPVTAFTDVAVQTVDLSNNKLRVVRADILRALYPSLRVLLLNDNLITSLPVALIDGSLTSLTLAGNPLKCDCAQPWLSQSNVVRLSAIVADWDKARCADGRPLQRFASSDYRCAAAAPTGNSRRASVVWSVGVTLFAVLLIATGLTIVGCVACGRRRRTKIYDVISVDGNKSTTVVLVMYCVADDDWIHSKLMPLLRQSSSSMTGVVRLSLKTIDTAGHRQTSSRQFVDNIRRSLTHCRLAVVVVSSNFVDEISRHDDAISGLLRDSAVRCVYVSRDADVAGGGVETVRREFGPGVVLHASDDDVVERIRAEMTSSIVSQRQPRPFPERGHEDAIRQLMNDEKY